MFSSCFHWREISELVFCLMNNNKISLPVRPRLLINIHESLTIVESGRRAEAELPGDGKLSTVSLKRNNLQIWVDSCHFTVNPLRNTSRDPILCAFSDELNWCFGNWEFSEDIFWFAHYWGGESCACWTWNWFRSIRWRINRPFTANQITPGLLKLTFQEYSRLLRWFWVWTCPALCVLKFTNLGLIHLDFRWIRTLDPLDISIRIHKSVVSLFFGDITALMSVMRVLMLGLDSKCCATRVFLRAPMRVFAWGDRGARPLRDRDVIAAAWESWCWTRRHDFRVCLLGPSEPKSNMKTLWSLHC